MAGIPISEIPNAPRLAGPSLIERGAARNGGISGTTRTLLGSPMSTSGAKAQAEAYKDLGNGVKDLASLGKVPPKVAAVLLDWQERKAEMRDYEARNQMVKVHDEGFAAFQKNIAGQPDSVIQKELGSYYESTTRELQGFNITPESRQEIEAYHALRLSEAKRFGLQSSNQLLVQQGLANATALYEKLMGERRFADADKVLTDGTRIGFFRKEKAQALENKAMTGIEREDMAKFIADHPFGARDYIAEYQKTGQNPHYSRLTAEEMANSGIRAQASIRDLQRRTSDEIDSAVLSGQVRDETAIRDLAAEARLSDEEVRSHIAGLREVPVNTAEELAAAIKNRNLLSTTLANYDPAVDMDDRGYLDIKKTIRERLPMAEREAALAELQKRRKEGRTFSGALIGDIYSKIDSVFDRKAPYAEPSAPERQAQIWQKSTNLKAQAKKYFQTNPTASTQDARRWLSDAISDEVTLRAATPQEGR